MDSNISGGFNLFCLIMPVFVLFKYSKDLGVHAS